MELCEHLTWAELDAHKSAYNTLVFTSDSAAHQPLFCPQICSRPLLPVHGMPGYKLTAHFVSSTSWPGALYPPGPAVSTFLLISTQAF
eukprot:88062-Pelagomonas_calceolata.AAC.4